MSVGKIVSAVLCCALPLCFALGGAAYWQRGKIIRMARALASSSHNFQVKLQQGNDEYFQTMPPSDEDVSLPGGEDNEYLDGVLKEIFPNGHEGLSPEKKSTAVLQYVSAALKFKDDSGTATKILKDGHAICGGKALVFSVLSRKCGVPSRYFTNVYGLAALGGHSVCENYYDGKWHMFDPSCGVFVYTKEKYDGKGRIVSLRGLMAAGAPLYGQRVVQNPGEGKYDGNTAGFCAGEIPKNYFERMAPGAFSEGYVKAMQNAFPVAFGRKNMVSFPIDADLAKTSEFTMGVEDKSQSDILNAMSTRMEGSHYLGQPSYVPAIHTWFVKCPENSFAKLRYKCVDTNPPLWIFPLKAAHVVRAVRSEDATEFVLRFNGKEAAFAVICDGGVASIDGVKIQIMAPSDPLLQEP